jgi:hypothetical protein
VEDIFAPARPVSPLKCFVSCLECYLCSASLVQELFVLLRTCLRLHLRFCCAHVCDCIFTGFAAHMSATAFKVLLRTCLRLHITGFAAHMSATAFKVLLRTCLRLHLTGLLRRCMRLHFYRSCCADVCDCI